MDQPKPANFISENVWSIHQHHRAEEARLAARTPEEAEHDRIDAMLPALEAALLALNARFTPEDYKIALERWAKSKAKKKIQLRPLLAALSNMQAIEG